jgi:hypothetical protein
MYFSLFTDTCKQGAMPDVVENGMQGREVKETDEVDVMLHYCEENNVMEWRDIEMESDETYGGQDCYMEWELNNVELNMTGIMADNDYDMEWECNDIELETTELYVGQNYEVAGQVSDMIGLEMECSTVEFESGGLNVGKKRKLKKRRREV